MIQTTVTGRRVPVFYSTKVQFKALFLPKSAPPFTQKVSAGQLFLTAEANFTYLFSLSLRHEFTDGHLMGRRSRNF